MMLKRFLLFTFLLLCFSACGTEHVDNGSNSGTSDGSSSSGGNVNTIKNPTINIKNNTGYTISDIRIKPSTSTSWGSNLWGYSYLSDGASRAYTISESLSANNVYDIILESSSGGYTFRKYMVTVSNGMTITFTASDFDDGSNLPSITIQNRSGIAFNAIHIKPTSSSDWGESFESSLSNNYDKTITIPIPLSSYTEFDIQMRSSNPTNTYTKNNVTVSDGMVLTYTSADAENPLIGNPIIVIENNTGYTISDIHIKQPTSTSWGSNLWGYSSLSDGILRTFTLSEPLSANSVYDIKLESSSGGYTFTKYDLTLSEGIIVNFTSGDLE